MKYYALEKKDEEAAQIVITKLRTAILFFGKSPKTVIYLSDEYSEALLPRYYMMNNLHILMAMSLSEFRERATEKMYDGELRFRGLRLYWFCGEKTEIKEKPQTVESEFTMGFEDALKLLKMCNRVARIGWKRDFIEVQLPDQDSKMTKPYIFMSSETGAKVPFLPSQDDLLSSDWVLVT